MNRRVMMIAFSALTVSMAGFAFDGNGGGQGGGQDQRLRTPLHGPAINHERPSGHADFRLESAKKRTDFTVEVEDVNLADGTTLSVMVTHNGTQTTVGTLKLTGQRGELELRSQDGDIVPTIAKGDMVAVSNGSAAILSGVF